MPLTSWLWQHQDSPMPSTSATPKPAASSSTPTASADESVPSHTRPQPNITPITTSAPPSLRAPPLFSSPTATTLISTITLTTLTLSLLHIHRTYLRRIPSTHSIPPTLFRHARRTLYGRVAAVTDADNFRLFHTPGGIFNFWRTYHPSLAGKIPFKWRHVPSTRKQLLSAGTIHVRIAGIDAPELAHFGKPAQAHSKEAMEWLTHFLEGRRVRVRLWRRDQYERVVGTAWIRKAPWWSKTDVGLEMIKAGWATVYEAKYGAEFGGKEMEAVYRAAESEAKSRKRGMWASSTKKGLSFITSRTPFSKAGANQTSSGGFWSRILSIASRRRASDQVGFETPREYKNRMAARPETMITHATTTTTQGKKP